MTPRSSFLTLGGTLALVLALGCGRDDVAHYRVPKEAEPTPAMGMPSMGMPGGMGGGDATDAPQAAANSLKWTLPKGWTEEKGSGMRFATLKPPTAGKLDVSVVMLPGAAGGELANVNRWRNQIGLAPLDEAAATSQRQVLNTKAGNLSVYDFTSDGQAKTRVVAGLITTADGNTWFLKMTGDAGPVAQAKSEFMHLMGSIRLD